MAVDFLQKEVILGGIAIIFGLVALSTLAWTMMKYPTEQFPGERFALIKIPVLFTLLSPISIITFAGFVSFACGLEALRDYLARLPASIKILAFVFCCFWAFAWSYEVIWQFSAWIEAYILAGGNVFVDQLHILPNQLSGDMAHNFVYRTKEVFFATAAGIYGAYFFNGIMRAEGDYDKARHKARKSA